MPTSTHKDIKNNGYSSINETPLVTVITVVFNGSRYLETTIESIVNQSYSNIEYIVIDGGSTDGTLDIIRKYNDHISYWVSEKDNGIYDAMNKGISIAHGEWINFMNAGDAFTSRDVINDIFSSKHSRATVIYGDTEVLYPSFSRLAKAKRVEYISKGMPFCHQSAFVRGAYHKLNPFNTSNSIAADMEFFSLAYCSKLSFLQLPLPISKVLSGGVSDKKRIRTLFAWWKTSYKLGFSKVLVFYFFSLAIAEILKLFAKLLLSERIVSKLQNRIR